MKKHLLYSLCLSVAALALPLSAGAQTSVQPSVLVCRAHQCADTAYSMTKGFLFNKIAQMFKNNTGKMVLLCDADPISHICLNQGIEISAETAFAPTNIVIDSLRLADEKLLTGETGLDAVFDYRIRANNTYPACQLALTRVSVDDVDKVEMTTQDTLCNITETGRTSINATYAVNYLDFDYGFLGAYYTIGVGEAVQGDKTGYVMMRFTEKAPQAEDIFPEEQSAPTVSETEQEGALPAILQQTSPEVSLEELLGTTQKTAVQEAPVAVVEPVVEPVVEEAVEETAPEAITETAVEVVEEPPVPTVIKTTIVEKTVITPDGKRQVSPPETRTLINGELQL